MLAGLQQVKHIFLIYGKDELISGSGASDME
jgi:hypothetical protein